MNCQNEIYKKFAFIKKYDNIISYYLLINKIMTSNKDNLNSHIDDTRSVKWMIPFYLSLWTSIIVIVIAFFSVLLWEKEPEADVIEMNCNSSLYFSEMSKEQVKELLDRDMKLLPCNVSINWNGYTIPYERLIDYNMLSNEKLRYYFEMLDPISRMNLMDKLYFQMKSQYIWLSLFVENWLMWIFWCNLENWNDEWICNATFDWAVWIGEYKYDKFDKEKQWGGVWIYCQLKRQTKEYWWQDPTTLLYYWVEKCKVQYMESWWDYEFTEAELNGKTKEEIETEITNLFYEKIKEMVYMDEINVLRE